MKASRLDQMKLRRELLPRKSYVGVDHIQGQKVRPRSLGRSADIIPMNKGNTYGYPKYTASDGLPFFVG